MSFHQRLLPAATLSARDRRALGLGTAVCLGALAAARGWPAYRTWAERGRTEAAVLVREVAHVRHGVLMQAATRDSARARAERLAFYETSLVGGRTPAAAAAELGSLIREAADDAGLDIGPVTVAVDSLGSGRADARRGGADAARRDVARWYTRVRASADATGSFGAVTALLESLETGAQRLRVREFAVEAVAPGAVGFGAPPTGAPATGAPATGAPAPRLRVRFVVEGMARRRVALSQSASGPAGSEPPTARIAWGATPGDAAFSAPTEVGP